MADIDKLPLLREKLDGLDNKGEVVKIFDNLLVQINDPDGNIDSIKWAEEISTFLNCDVIEVETKAAEALAELCKSETPRPSLSNNQVIVPLIKMLSSANSKAISQACRAIGNICFDNNEARTCLFENYGLDQIVKVLTKCTMPDCDLALRTIAAGCLQNVIMGQDHIFSKVVEMGVMEIVCDILAYGVDNKQAEDTAIHIFVILGLLTEAGSGSVYLNEKLCAVAVKVLEESTNGELSELCVELLHSQAENEGVRLNLAKAGLCELLIDLMEKHGRLVDDDETRNLLKMACDLIVIILNEDKSMELAYGNCKGRVFEGMVSWLSSADDDLQVTAVLAMGNFARTDKHCIQMVNQGVSKKLLELLNQNNSSDSKIRLQHALLSALRNLVIPAVNKPIVLKQGLFQGLFPMFSIPTFPVVFKLLGTLRMVIDGQQEAASELGNKEDVILKLVEWSNTDDHPGVQGEAQRLIVWIIKNSRDRDVIGKLVTCNVIKCLVKMTNSEHAVMQGEAFLALNLTSAMRGQDSEPSLLSSNVGEAINNFLSKTPPREVFLNLLAFIGQLINSGQMRKHLCEAGVPKALYSTILNDSLSDLTDQVTRLATMLDNG